MEVDHTMLSTIQTELYVIPLGTEISPREREQWLPYIPKEKRERIPRFRHWQDAQRTLLGYSLLSYLIHRETGIPRERMELTFDYYGKPHLQGAELYFNLSHSGDWIACVIGPKTVGVDVEKIQPIDLSIAEHFFASQEVSDLMALPEEKRYDYFFTLWSLKESYIKAEGKGVSIPLNSFWFRQTPVGEITFENIHQEDKWRYQLYSFDPSYKLAVSVDKTLSCPERVQVVTREMIG